MKFTILYRPVGLIELKLIEDSGMQSYPPRLGWQPIFYPVLNEKYACEIAEKWNTKDESSGYAGFVTSFEIPTSYYEQFEVQNVGSSYHNELWVPSDDLEEFNSQIKGKIKVIKAFYGQNFNGERKY